MHFPVLPWRSLSVLSCPADVWQWLDGGSSFMKAHLPANAWRWVDDGITLARTVQRRISVSPTGRSATVWQIIAAYDLGNNSLIIDQFFLWLLHVWRSSGQEKIDWRTSGFTKTWDVESTARSIRQCSVIGSTDNPENTRHWTNDGLMLSHRLRRWPKIKTSLV